MNDEELSGTEVKLYTLELGGHDDQPQDLIDALKDGENGVYRSAEDATRFALRTDQSMQKRVVEWTITKNTRPLVIVDQQIRVRNKKGPGYKKWDLEQVVNG